MKLRNSIYQRTIPPIVLLGFVYTLALLGFERSDASNSAMQRIQNRIQILTSSLDSGQVPNAFEGFNRLALAMKQPLAPLAVLQNETWQIRNKTTTQVLETWPRDPDPETAIGEHAESNLRISHFGKLRFSIQKVATLTVIRPIRDPHGGQPLELIWQGPHPAMVFVDGGFWRGLILVWSFLFLIAILLAEGIYAIIRAGLDRVALESDTFEDAAASTPNTSRYWISEIGALASAVHTLADTYSAKQQELCPVTGSGLLRIGMNAQLTRFRQITSTHHELELEGGSCTLWRHPDSIRQHGAFLFAGEACIHAFIGEWSHSTLNGFEAGAMESLLVDTIGARSFLENPDELHAALSSLRLVQSWTLIHISLSSRTVTRMQSGEMQPTIDQLIPTEDRLILPIGFKIMHPESPALTQGAEWKARIRDLFISDDKRAVLCVAFH
jgi:hypothetical protein